MALKDSKSTTPKVQKFTTEELKSLTNLQKQSQNLTFQFGQLYLSKVRLEEQEGTLKESIKSVEQQELTLAQELTDKYGKGSINIETGEFTPIKE